MVNHQLFMLTPPTKTRLQPRIAKSQPLTRLHQWLPPLHRRTARTGQVSPVPEQAIAMCHHHPSYALPKLCIQQVIGWVSLIVSSNLFLGPHGCTMAIYAYIHYVMQYILSHYISLHSCMCICRVVSATSRANKRASVPLCTSESCKLWIKMPLAGRCSQSQSKCFPGRVPGSRNSWYQLVTTPRTVKTKLHMRLAC